MREELPYFYIGDSYGGNQDWFSSFMMRKGGCAAETLCDGCIYFAKYFGRVHLCPFPAGTITQKEYVRFSEMVEPFLKPECRESIHWIFIWRAYPGILNKWEKRN